ncbi:MAG: BatA and WFA domain-containing protein [Nanoarchaeota archaeon]
MSAVDGILSVGESVFSKAGGIFTAIPGIEDKLINPGGLIAILILVPFVLLYLIRPKPQKKVIPSLMFLMKDKGQSILKSFFRNFIKDILFFLQLLIFLALIAAIAQPFLKVPEISVDKDTVIVLDASASMHAQSRWDDAVAIAKDSLSSRNTIVLAGKIPETIIIQESKAKTKQLLSTTQPRDTETNLYDAILASAQYLDETGRIFIISDFADDSQYETAIRTVESLGYDVYLRNVGSPAKNVGIIDLDIKETRTVVTVKNYDDEEANVRLSVNDRLLDTKRIPARGAELFTIETPSSVSKVDIDVPDDFPLDNEVHISAPDDHIVSILIITNDELITRKTFVVALDAINSNSTTKLRYEINNPPQVPMIDHDIIIFNDVDADLIIPGTIKATIDRVKEGGAAIVMAQDQLFGIGWNDLLPMKFITEDTEGVVFPHPASFSLTESVNFGTVGKYMIVEPTKTVTPIATVGNSPIIALHQLGKGSVIYYGIDDKNADFPKEPYYPIFWKRAIDLLSGRPEINNLNFKTGRTVALTKEQNVKTPIETIKTSAILVNHQGIYTTEDRNIVANLLSESESDITPRPGAETKERITGESVVNYEQMDIASYLILAALILLFVELLALKIRGDI